jgi:hypothetical protein
MKRLYGYLRLLLAVSCLALVGFAAVGCASESLRAELHCDGMYRSTYADGSIFYIDFDEDGTLKGVSASSGMSESEVRDMLSYFSQVSGTYEVNGTEIKFEYTGGAPSTDEAYHYEGGIEADRLVVTGDDGERRTFDYVD